MSEDNKLEKALKDSERIAVIGSPSSTTQLAIDILGSAAHKKLVGELSLFSFTQDGRKNYAMGQITEVELRNVWHEDPTMRSLIRERGRVDPVSERQDTHLGEMTVSAVFQEKNSKYQPSMLGTIPPTGTSISIVTDDVLDALLESQRNELFYLGNVYGSSPKLPLWFKHFGLGERGAGEAYHLGVFGKTGSGKSVLSKMILTGYARHKELGIFIIDPQGEFSKDLSGSTTGNFKLPLKAILEGLGRELLVCKVKDLVLDTFDLFEKILYESDFFQKLSMPGGENRRIASQELIEKLRGKVKLSELHIRESFDAAWKIIGEGTYQTIVYKSTDSRERFNNMYISADKDGIYSQIWKPVSNLFNTSRPNGVSINSLIAKAVLPGTKRPIVIVDLSHASAINGSEEAKVIWNDSIQATVIKRFLDMIKVNAEKVFKEDTLLNSLVIIDEAHRLAPSGETDNEQHAGLKRSLVDAARTTRKYGLGWMFISQTLASLDKEIWGQMGVYFFGFGLSAGTEYRTLQEIVGGNSTALKLYQTFRHPQSAFDADSKEYPFMTYGPVSPLSFAGTPLFLSAFTSPERFTKENGLKTR